MPLNKKQVVDILNKVKSEKLTTLVLEKCNLNNLMDQICQLTHLEVLDLQYTHLTTLPKEIKNLSNLVHLDLSKNQLSFLPDSIGEISSLKYLDLSNNYSLTKLPTSIGGLSHLEKLVLCDTKITDFPDEICNLTSLKELIIRDRFNTYHPSSSKVIRWLKTLHYFNFGYKICFNEIRIGDEFNDSNPYGIIGRLNEAQIKIEEYILTKDEFLKTKIIAYIKKIFDDFPDLKDILPTIYSLISVNELSDLSSSIKSNFFKLPTKHDYQWMMNAHNVHDIAIINNPISSKDRKKLRNKLFNEGRKYRLSESLRVYINEYQQEGKIEVSRIIYYKKIPLLKLFHEDRYKTIENISDDSCINLIGIEARIYRSGEARLYIKLYNNQSITWYVSENDGRSWDKIHPFLNDYMENRIILQYGFRRICECSFE